MLMHHLDEVLSEHIGEIHRGFLPNEGEYVLFCLAQTCWIAQQEPDQMPRRLKWFLRLARWSLLPLSVPLQGRILGCGELFALHVRPARLGNAEAATNLRTVVRLMCRSSAMRSTGTPCL